MENAKNGKCPEIEININGAPKKLNKSSIKKELDASTKARNLQASAKENGGKPNTISSSRDTPLSMRSYIGSGNLQLANNHSKSKLSSNYKNSLRSRLEHPPQQPPAPRSSSSLNPCQSHSFFTDVADVRQMEKGLLQLLDDFHFGKLQAFGEDITFEKMELVREQQEKLARLHFELNAQQEIYGHESEEGRKIAKENMSKLIEDLQKLSFSIEQLQARTTNIPSYFTKKS